MNILYDFLHNYLNDDLIYILWQLIKAVLLILPVTLVVAYLTFAERKILAYMHARVGANRVGPKGVLQPFADLLKFVFKEILVPSLASTKIFYFAPILTLVCAFLCWVVVPFSPELVFSNINAGLLYIMAVSSFGVYGIILAGWASNSKYAFLGAIRASAQMVSYELAMGFALIGIIMVSGSLNIIDIVNCQSHGIFAGSILSWNFIPLFPLFLIYLISGVVETNRAPFDVAEGESEIVAGFHVEYSGTTFALFMLAEYANMILVSTLTALLFLGGWLSPFPRAIPVIGNDSMFWLILKVLILLFGFIWYRATFPRYRYDQIMRLGWKVFLPITLVWIFLLSIWIISPYNIFN
jgi:NADH-quinone oxidoreductase subunit H